MTAKPTDPKKIQGPKSARPAWRRGLAEFLLGERAALLIPSLMALAAILFPFVYGNGYWTYEIPLILCLALVVSGVNLSFGFAGELQLGQVFMFAAGAYIPMILAVRGVTTDIVALMIIGGAVATLVGVLVAVPALRIGGWSLAMASLFLMILVPDLTSIFIKYTGGLNGLVGIPLPTLLGRPLGQTGLYLVTIVTTILWFAAYRNLVTSRYGVVFRVLRESPVLTKSLGFSTFRLKASIYGLGALPAGVAGCLFGFLSQILSPSTFGLNFGIGTVAASLFGGSESVYGVLFGAVVLQLGPQESASFASYSPVVYGLFLIVAATVLRGGISRLGKLGTRRVAKWLDPEAVQGATVGIKVADENGISHLIPGLDSAPVEADATHGLEHINGKALQAQDVKMMFGGVKALKGVSLSAEPGQVTALIGSNGSGKTTLLNVICGYATPQEGAVLLDGQSVSGLKPYRRARLGIGRTFQTPTIPRGVSVRDVVASGRYSRDHIGFAASTLRLPRYWRAQRADRATATALLDMVGLSDVAKQEAASLPLGTRRLVEVVRTLCGEPGVVLLDEPASGLNEIEVERLAKLLTRLAEAGATVIVIEHNFHFIRRVADCIHVMHLGEVIASGPIDQVTNDPKVIESYLGSGPEHRVPTANHALTRTPAAPAAAATLVIEGLESGYGDLRVLRDLSLSVAPGTIEVVLGRNGVGKTTLLSNIAGLLPTWKGSVHIQGQSVARMAPYKRAAAGIVLVQEGKRVFRQRTVWQNVMLGTHAHKLRRKQREALAREVLADFPILQDRINQRAGGLSGGQQQMLLIAQALAARPKILLLDEPSAGLAPAIVDDLFVRLRRLADDGLSIMLVEQLAQRALAIADHVTVIDAGRVIAEGPPEDFMDAERLEAAYFGA